MKIPSDGSDGHECFSPVVWKSIDFFKGMKTCISLFKWWWAWGISLVALVWFRIWNLWWLVLAVTLTQSIITWGQIPKDCLDEVGLWACLWGDVLIALVDVGQLAHYGKHSSLGLDPQLLRKRSEGAFMHSRMHSFSLLLMVDVAVSASCLDFPMCQFCFWHMSVYTGPFLEKV